MPIGRGGLGGIRAIPGKRIGRSRAFRSLKGASNALWTPANLVSGLQFWVDATDISTVTLSGTNVTAWADKSGNARNLTGFNNPQYSRSGFPGSLPGVTFDAATSTYLENTSFGLGTTVLNTFAAVQRNSGSANQYQRFVALASSNTTPDWTNPGYIPLLQNVATTNYLTYLNGGTTAPATSGILADESHIAESWWDSSKVYMYVDGNSHASGTVSYPSFTQNVIALGINAGDHADTTKLSGAIGEVVIVSGYVSTIDRQLIEGYMAWRWGLQAKLPAGHPYLNAPPIVMGPISATLAATEANDTISAAATLPVIATLTATEANDTISAAATLPVTATLTATEAADTLSAAAGNIVGATLSVTEANDTLSGAAVAVVGATLTITESADALAAAGTLPVTATASPSESADTLTAAATHPDIATLTATEAGDALGAAATLSVIATLTATEANDALAASGSVTAEYVVPVNRGDYYVNARDEFWKDWRRKNAPKSAKKQKAAKKAKKATAAKTAVANLRIVEDGDRISATATVDWDEDEDEIMILLAA